MNDTITVAARYRGPEGAGNGGYCAGLLAERIEGDAVVRLSASIPLETPLRFVREDGRERLCRSDDGMVLAEAWHEPLEFDVLPAPDDGHLDRMTAAFSRAPNGPFAHCFGCGEARGPDDSIRVLSGRLPGESLCGSRWRPHAAFAGPDGALAPRYVWTALDCTGGLAVEPLDERPVMTGTMHGRVLTPVHAGEDHTVIGWPIGKDSRKIVTGTAIYGADGVLKAVARSIWIALQPDKA